jgi:drug/metabolite transporter (DMT)-like permease
MTLLIAAIISGLSFVAQKNGMDFVGPFTFNTLRAFIGSITLFVIIIFLKIFSKDKTIKFNKREYKTLSKGGLICGILLFAGLSINQICMLYSSAGKAGFITSLYILFVPLISIFLDKKLGKNVIYGIVLALCGLFFLCFKTANGFKLSDGFLLVSAIFFAIQLIAVGYFAKKVNPLKLALAEFLVMGFLSLPFALILESPNPDLIIAGMIPILFAGVIVTAGTYTLQIFGQKATNPTIASLILSSEAIFATLGGMIFLNESMTYKEILGCILMLLALVVTQINFDKKLRRIK